MIYLVVNFELSITFQAFLVEKHCQGKQTIDSFKDYFNFFNVKI